jgi:hypothetical protein
MPSKTVVRVVVVGEGFLGIEVGAVDDEAT